ncbi:MAG: hypothetical protein OXE45_09550 [bacterium]|nr:hypothetical protein [bacterium]
MPALLQKYAWDVRIGSGGPSLWEDAGGELKYSRSGGDFGVEPIAIIQDHLGVLPRMRPQLLQEFCLYHNLWNADGRVFKKLNDDGTEEDACEVSEDLVRVRTKLLRQFQAAAQFVLVKYMDSIVATSHLCDDHVLDREIRGEDHYLHLSIRENKQTGAKSSLLRGKKVILPPPRSECGQWPFERQEDVDFPEFVIGETPEGDPIKSTCDPDALDDYFDLNSGAPHYLTPVYFTPEVLDYYYSEPKYEVRDGYLSCGGLWGVSVDNNHPEHVMVWLGDLGRDLPANERHHWLFHNIFVPDGTPSRTAFERQISGQWADAESPAWRLQAAYKRFRVDWAAEWGWDLFRDPDDDDPQLLASLRVPPRGGNREFGEQVQALDRLMVESVNTRQLKSELPECEKNEKSIALLERWLDYKGYQHLEQDISVLRKIHDLRNVSEHRAGRKRTQAFQKHQIGDDKREAVSTLFEEAISLLGSLGEMHAEAVIKQS